MKNKKLIPWILFTTFISTASCVVGITDNISSTEIFRYINQSGVEIALVGETNDNFDIPDSLVLQNGESHECSISYSPVDKREFPKFPYKVGAGTIPNTYFPLKIYFDKTIYQTYYFNETNRDLRNPFYYDSRNPALGISESSYVTTTREEKKQKHIKIINTYTYTFTAEDYQNALKAQDNTGKR